MDNQLNDHREVFISAISELDRRTKTKNLKEGLAAGLKLTGRTLTLLGDLATAGASLNSGLNKAHKVAGQGTKTAQQMAKSMKRAAQLDAAFSGADALTEVATLARDIHEEININMVTTSGCLSRALGPHLTVSGRETVPHRRSRCPRKLRGDDWRSLERRRPCQRCRTRLCS